jgi:putative tricarboxylic transport membrane protein
MTGAQRDRLAGLILLLVSAVWIAGVYLTIPAVASSARVGPRGFPLAMGVMLGVLSLILIVSSTMNGEKAEARQTETKADSAAATWALLVTFGFLAAYAVLMNFFGFLVGTIVATAAFLVLALNRRSPKLIAAVSLGLAFGIWLILDKTMGVYLPRGSIIDWF